MLTLDALRSRPAAFRSLTGMGVEDFDALYDDFLAAQAARRRAATAHPRRRPPSPRLWRGPQARPRRPPPPAHGLGLAPHLPHLRAARLLLRPAQAQRPAQRPRRRRDPGRDGRLSPSTGRRRDRKKLGSVAAVMDAFPQVRLVIDAKEQRVERPAGRGPPEAVLLGQEAVPHGQDPGGRHARRGDRRRLVERAGRGVARPDVAAVQRRAVAAGRRRRRGGDARQGVRRAAQGPARVAAVPAAPGIAGASADRRAAGGERDHRQVSDRGRAYDAQLNKYGALKQVWRSTVPRHSRATRAGGHAGRPPCPSRAAEDLRGGLSSTGGGIAAL